VLGSTTFWQLLLWSHLHQHAWLFQPNGYTLLHDSERKGSQATLMEDRRDLWEPYFWTYVLSFIEGSCFMSSRHNATWSRAA
jgi:hypothetical protein